MTRDSTPVPPDQALAAVPDDPAQQGEANDTTKRRYSTSVKEVVDSGQVDQAARDVEPDSADQARDLQDAEEAGRSHARK